MTFYFRFYCTPFSCCEMTLSSFSSYLRYVVDFTDVNLSKSLVIARKAPDFNMILTLHRPQEVSGRKGCPSYIVQADQVQGLLCNATSFYKHPSLMRYVNLNLDLTKIKKLFLESLDLWKPSKKSQGLNLAREIWSFLLNSHFTCNNSHFERSTHNSHFYQSTFCYYFWLLNNESNDTLLIIVISFRFFLGPYFIVRLFMLRCCSVVV